MSAFEFRGEVRPSDIAAVRELAQATGFFTPSEVDIAAELVEERVAKGDASGYHFIVAERDGRLAGYACFGLIPCTEHSWDLYWIVVHPDTQGQGLGRELLRAAEAAVARFGGTRVYIETSSRPLYAPTQGFYLRCGYREEARLPDFYSPGDAKIIYVRAL